MKIKNSKDVVKKEKRSNVFRLCRDVTVVIIIVGAIVTALVLNVKQLVELRDSSINNIDMWEEAYKKVESSRVGILFNDINTTMDEYTQLRIECNKAMERDIRQRHIDATLEVDAKITEETFVDGVRDEKDIEDRGKEGIEDREEAVSNIQEEDIHHIQYKGDQNVGEYVQNKQSSQMVETGPLYFQDMLLLRYINELGELKIIAALFADEDKNEVITLRQSEVAQYTRERTLKNVGESNKTDGSDKTISELDYVNIIGDTVVKIIKAEDEADIHEVEKLIIKYFTIEGRKTIFENRRQLKFEGNININYIVAGQSDINVKGKDRVYIQLGIKNEGADVPEQNTLLNVILKLNNRQKIFDVDII